MAGEGIGATQGQGIDWNAYTVEHVEMLPTPRLLVYRPPLERNIAAMRRHLESVVPGSGFRHLAAHVKTHKSAWVTRLLMEHGVEKFKCTPHEIDFLLETGVKDVLLAYPLLAHDAERLAERIVQHPETRVTAQIGSKTHAERLAAAARRRGIEIDCLIDVDVGHHRTGIQPGLAPDLARSVLSSKELGSLRIRGIHAYDGHNSSPDPAARDACAREAMQRVADCARSLEAAGIRVERIVVGGSPGFLPDLRELVVRHRVDAQVDVSPGTWVYWDSNYAAKMPGMFDIAALVLAQVMDLPGDGLATLNLGYKRWSIDQGPVQLFSVPGLEVVSTNEEHTVLRVPAGTSLRVEDRVWIVPRHICSTVNLWETFTLIGEGGRVEAAALPVSGRNR